MIARLMVLTLLQCPSTLRRLPQHIVGPRPSLFFLVRLLLCKRGAHVLPSLFRRAASKTYDVVRACEQMQALNALGEATPVPPGVVLDGGLEGQR